MAELVDHIRRQIGHASLNRDEAAALVALAQEVEAIGESALDRAPGHVADLFESLLRGELSTLPDISNTMAEATSNVWQQMAEVEEMPHSGSSWSSQRLLHSHDYDPLAGESSTIGLGDHQSTISVEPLSSGWTEADAFEAETDVREPASHVLGLAGDDDEAKELCVFLVKPSESSHWGGTELVPPTKAPHLKLPRETDHLQVNRERGFRAAGKVKYAVAYVAGEYGEKVGDRYKEIVPFYGNKFGKDAKVAGALEGSQVLHWRIPHKFATNDMDAVIKVPVKTRFQPSADWALDFDYTGDSKESILACTFKLELRAFSWMTNRPIGTEKLKNAGLFDGSSIRLVATYYVNPKQHMTVIHVTRPGSLPDLEVKKGVPVPDGALTSPSITPASRSLLGVTVSATQDMKRDIEVRFSPDEVRKTGGRVFTLAFGFGNTAAMHGRPRYHGELGKRGRLVPHGATGFEFKLIPLKMTFSAPDPVTWPYSETPHYLGG